MIRLLLAMLVVLTGCGDTRRAVIEALRSATTPPEVPPDTVPEFLDYAADLQVDLSEMVKLPDGVLYRDLTSGSGAEIAPGDSVIVHYLGWLPSGVLVDSALIGIRVGAGDVIPGIDLALPGMKAGGIRKLVLSPGLGFGPEGTYGIPPGSVLVYDLEVRERIP